MHVELHHERRQGRSAEQAARRAREVAPPRRQAATGRAATARSRLGTGKLAKARAYDRRFELAPRLRPRLARPWRWQSSKLGHRHHRLVRLDQGHHLRCPPRAAASRRRWRRIGSASRLQARSARPWPPRSMGYHRRRWRRLEQILRRRRWHEASGAPAHRGASLEKRRARRRLCASRPWLGPRRGQQPPPRHLDGVDVAWEALSQRRKSVSQSL